jgi:hypothetical protein
LSEANDRRSGHAMFDQRRAFVSTNSQK